MKKILAVFSCLILLTSCLSDETEEDKTENVVFGIWNNYYEDSDSLVMTRVFTYDYYSYFSFAEGKVQDEYNKQEYYIQGNQLVLDRYTQTFRIEKDTLWITNSKQDQVTKYIKSENQIIN